MTSYDSWKTSPPDPDPECPECGGPIESNRYEAWCLDEKCGWHYEAHEPCDEKYDEWKDEGKP